MYDIVYLHDFYDIPCNHLCSIQVEAGGQTHEFDHVVSSIPSSGTCVFIILKIMVYGQHAPGSS